MPPQVSIVIATRNRREDLRRALASCLRQRDVPFEVLVYDDASGDGTAAMVTGEFPTVRLFRSEENVDCVRHRNSGFRESQGEFVVSLDDDAEFSDPLTLARVVELFRAAPEAAIVALPFEEPHRATFATAMRPAAAGARLRVHVNCAAAFRRRLILELGGYPDLLCRQGEERDLSIRVIDAGYAVVYGDTPSIIHHTSPSRSYERMDYLGYRNTILFSWMRIPFPYWPGRMAISTLQLLRHKFSLRRLPARLYMIGAGYLACARFFRSRHPVSVSAYRQFRSLPAHGPLPPGDRAAD